VIGLVGAFVTENPFATILPIIGAGVLIRAIGVLRSKVIVDAVAMHVRGTLGWQHVEWEDVLDFLVEKRTTRAGAMHAVVIFRSKGRPISPTALAADTNEDAEQTVTLLRRFARPRANSDAP
jgi:hypothetical protein